MNESILRLDGIAVDGQWAKFRDLLKQLDAERIGICQVMIRSPFFSIKIGSLHAKC
jgi:hypothetical protein